MNTSETLSYRSLWSGSSLKFDNFAVGKANQLATSVAKQAAEHLDFAHNPLFIYGGCGLGKTHLMQAIANKIKTDRPHEKVCYLYAEQFVSDVVRTWTSNKFDEFNEFYDSLDVLLIDDIQFLSGKSNCQKHLSSLFDEFVNAKKRIVLAGDIHPNNLTDFNTRLNSRFFSGLIFTIEQPDIENRAAILLLKSHEYAIPISEGVANFIAECVTSNIRSLEGALRKTNAYAKFHNLPITVDVAKEAIKDYLPTAT